MPRCLPPQAGDLATGIRATDLHQLETAREHFDQVLTRDPISYDANWRLPLVRIDHAKNPHRNSLYALAESYAHRAVAADPTRAEGHFVLANAVGHASLSRGPKERIRRALLVRNEALRAFAIDPAQNCAWHILGRWNAEVERLPALEKFFARTFLGAAVFGSASWAEAARGLRLAVHYAPTVIVHRLDLAGVLVWRKEWSPARQQLDLLATLPVVDNSDTSYQRQGRELMAKVRRESRP
jgi:hypothetical protein